MIQSMILCFICGIVFTIKGIYENIKFYFMKKRFQLIAGTVTEILSYNNQQKQIKISFTEDDAIKFILMNQFKTSIGDTVKFFYNKKTGEAFRYNTVNSSRKEFLIMGVSGILFAIILLIIFSLITTLKNSQNSFLEGIGYFLGLAYIFLGIYLFFKNKNADSSIEEEVQSTGEYTFNDENSIPDGCWRCMGCGKFNSNSTKRCSCGYKK